MRQYANEKNIPFLLYEAGESLRFDEFSIRSGINGILGVMHKLDMLSVTKHKLKKVQPYFVRTSIWVRATHSGILKPYKKLGKKVRCGETLAIIANPTGLEEHKLTSPITGIVIGLSNLPIVHEGAALYHIACLDEADEVAKQIESLQDYYEDDIDKQIQL